MMPKHLQVDGTNSPQNGQTLVFKDGIWVNAPGPSYAIADLAGQEGNVDNVALSLANGQTLIGPNIAFNGDAVEVTEQSPLVKIFATAAEWDEGDGTRTAAQRVSPALKIVKDRGCVISLLAVSATGYQRHTRGTNDSSNTVFYFDTDHQVGDLYILQGARSGTNTEPTPITNGQFVVEAINNA